MSERGRKLCHRLTVLRSEESLHNVTRKGGGNEMDSLCEYVID